MGVPRYGTEDLTLAIEAVSGDLVGASFTPNGAKEGFGEEAVSLTTSASGEVTTEPGLNGALVVDNDGAEPLVLVISANSWDRSERAIAESEEKKFIERVSKFGIDPEIAKMAVWNEDLASTLPVRVVVSGGPTPARGVVTRRDAASGSCATGYTLSSFSRDFAFYSSIGKLWETGFVKRWCRNATRKLVGSGYFFLKAPMMTTLGSSSYSFQGNINVDDRFTSYGGSSQGAHWSTKTHHIKQCFVLKIPYCDDIYHQYWVTGNYDGSKTGGWPTGANPI